ncbi:thiamine pyrophosphate-binding protein [Porticoccaceae bacterium]|nr:thiamine pyrophosphate-binding protein [Porticoccaceae bacterium]
MDSVSLQIVKFIKKSGITQVFTVTGGGAMFLNKAFDDVYGARICYMHHEQACAMAAEGHARIAGRPAVVNVTTGPGAINAMNGVFGAYTDSIPMVVVSGQVKRETLVASYKDEKLRQLGDQEAKIIEMVNPICKYAVLVKTVKELEVELPKVIHQASSGRPGPVWIDIPSDIQMSQEKLEFRDYRPRKKQLKRFKGAGLASLVRSLITSSKRPLILAGSGIRVSKTVEKLGSFSRKCGIPIATAWTHDLIESNSPYFAGRAGTIGTRPGNFCLQNADLVFVLGSRLNIRQTSFNWDSFAKNAVIVHVDIDESELNKFYLHSHYKLNMDLNDFFTDLESLEVSGYDADFKSWRGWCTDIGQTYAVKNESFLPAIQGKLNPYKAILKISDALIGDEIIVCGNASACIIPFQCVELTKDQRLFSNSGSASMGYDLPAAIGACVALNEERARNVICFAGDGSIQMNIQELQTIASKKLNIKIFVINNNGYLSIRSTHENFFGSVFGAHPESGVDFPDICKIATAYGIKSHSINSLKKLDSISKILSKKGPVLIELVVDERQEFCPKLKSRMGEDGSFLTPELDDMFPFLTRDVLRGIHISAKGI